MYRQPEDPQDEMPYFDQRSHVPDARDPNQTP